MSAADRSGLAARHMAVRLLAAVLQDRRPFDEAFEQIGPEERFIAMEPRDRAFARAIVMVALRRYGQLTTLINHFIDKPLPQKRGSLDEILLSAAAQLLFLRTPPHAAINLAVFQVRGDFRSRRFARLANAILRRISEQGAALMAAQDQAKLNTPDWLWLRWVAAYGLDDTYKIASQHLIEPPLDLTVKANAQDWAKRLRGVVLPTGSVRIAHKGRIEELAGFADGEWWVQDAAASLPAQLLGDVRGKLVADLCAAPGGKTAQLAYAGAKVFAVDVSEKRMERLKANLERLKLEAEIITADATQWQPSELLDAVLLDAPCSATGTVRRHPDIPYLKRAKDIDELAGLQQKLLQHAHGLLKPGGMLVYCTCSLEPAEGGAQITRFLAEHGDMELVAVKPAEVSGRTEWIDEMGTLRTLPCDLQLSDPDLSGMDGFYAARLVKKG